VPRLSMTLFARFHVALDGVPYLAFHSDKARALLACLAVEAGVPHRREVLAGLLWPGYPERSARQSLSQALLSLVPLAAAPSPHDAPLLTVSRAEIQLNSDAFSADVVEFTSLLAECQRDGHREAGLCPACVTRLERALALYTGELLAGFSVRDSPEFEEWLLAWRERYRRQAALAAAALATWGERGPGGDRTVR
jgi:DNA-binding SARP family transcriptional activator